MLNEPLLELTLPGVKKLKSGKVREVFDLGDRLLFVASDRISAFDVVMPNGIPRKGEVLTQLSYHWFDLLAPLTANHLAARATDPLPPDLQKFSGLLARRSMVVKKAAPLAIECVVRGYLTGSGWKDYQKTGCVCGIKLPAGLQDSCQLPAPVFTPATKAETGHDENISFEEASALVGAEVAEKARDLTLKIYCFAAEYALKRGIIIADTKFEFGLCDGKLILPPASGPPPSTSPAAASLVLTSSSSAIIWKLFLGTKSRPRPPCRRKSWPRPPRNTWKLFSG
jgi:phosphoribosylaminoimidazole-succinocarboxamide synthase